MENPYCNGIEGILEAYHQSLKTVQLYGPTNFAPVVNHVARWGGQCRCCIADSWLTSILYAIQQQYVLFGVNIRWMTDGESQMKGYILKWNTI